MRLSWKIKLFLIGVVLTLIGLSLYPLFEDPFHEKKEKICFWEWLYKEIHELLHGEKEEKEECKD